jgi:hypothetical protein
MSTNKNNHQTTKRQLAAERRKTRIDAVMGLTEADLPAEIKVSNSAPLARDIWKEMEERIGVV